MSEKYLIMPDGKKCGYFGNVGLVLQSLPLDMLEDMLVNNSLADNDEGVEKIAEEIGKRKLANES